MIKRSTAVALLGVAFIALVVVAVARHGGDDGYVVELRMANAHGLREGSGVTIGSIDAGSVERLEIDRRNRVVARLRIKPEYTPLTVDTAASVTTVNLLGQKRVELAKGDGRPLASGGALASSRVTVSTDLDQVLAVLDDATRARLTALVNEAASALSGRKDDLRRLLPELGPGFADVTQLLEQLGEDNHALGRLVADSSRFLDAANAKRRDIVQMVQRFDRIAATLSTRRAALRSTLAQAPGTLVQARAFLARLERATEPLAPAARRLQAVAPTAARTLEALDPFRVSATPALRDATRLAPELSRLAARSTPVLRRARAPLSTAEELVVERLPPVTAGLDKSAYNVLAILDNWSRAIQFRDGLSHFFRAEVSAQPDVVRSMVDRLAGRSTASRSGGATSQRGGAIGSARRNDLQRARDAAAAASPALRPLLDLLKP